MKLVWDEVGKRFYETGVEQVALYPMADGAYTKGVAWNGVTGIEENPSGAEETVLYADDIDYLSLRSKEKWAGTITAYTYPDEFAECDGSKAILPGFKAGQQVRKRFGLAYKTLVGNDTEFEEHGYIIHVLYNASAAVSQKSHQTINDTPEAVEFSWEVNANSIKVEDIPNMKLKSLSTLEIDSRKYTVDGVVDAKLKAVEDALFGTDPVGQEEGTDPMLLTPKQIYDLLKTV